MRIIEEAQYCGKRGLHITDAFERLVADAEAFTFTGWDFSFLNGRWEEDEPSWDYRALILRHMASANAMLDMGTGGGEFLASLMPLPAYTAATEGYPANVPVARDRLVALGVDVRAIHDNNLPFADTTFDLVINRHESFEPREVWRVLQTGGTFITQQVGGKDVRGLNDALEDTDEPAYAGWSLATAEQQLLDAGFTIGEKGEEFPVGRFYDVGAVIILLKIAEWQIPDFTVERYRERLQRLHEQIAQPGVLVVHNHRFYIVAQKPTVME